MANTLKFGNGNWATQKGSVLAYNDENNNFKPLPFDFTRASTATYVDSDGLIKNAGKGEARIDYTDNTKGSLLLEPSRTNLITQSEAFDIGGWSKSNATVVSGKVSPTGNTSAFKLVEGTGVNTYHQIYKGNVFTPVLNNYYTFSFFAKPAERTVINGLLQTYNIIDVKFDLIAKTATVVSGLNATGTIKEHSNGWFKCTVSGQSSQVLGAYANIQLNNGSNNVYDGDGTSGAYIFGAQIELGSYATSYIPTQGSTVTRLADNAYQQNATQVIGQSEGTMYIEFVPKDISSAQILYQIRTTGSSNVGQIDIRLQGGNIRALGNDSASSVFSFNGGSYTVGTPYKVAVRYKTNDTKLYINGLFAASDTTCSFSSSTKNQISFGENLTALLPVADILDARLYNTALTDAELAALTQV